MNFQCMRKLQSLVGSSSEAEDEAEEGTLPKLRVLKEIAKLEQISFEHIFRSHNSQADQLSKDAFAGPVGVLFWEEWMEACLLDRGNLYLF